jgi:hypothetical protein
VKQKPITGIVLIYKIPVLVGDNTTGVRKILKARATCDSFPWEGGGRGLANYLGCRFKGQRPQIGRRNPSSIGVLRSRHFTVNHTPPGGREFLKQFKSSEQLW